MISSVDKTIINKLFFYLTIFDYMKYAYYVYYRYEYNDLRFVE